MRSSPGRSAAVALLVLVAGTLGSLLPLGAWRGQLEREDRAAVDRQVASRVAAIRAGMDGYENALQAERAFIDASGETGPGALGSFADGLHLPERYPGLQAIGFQASLSARTGTAGFTITPPDSLSRSLARARDTGRSSLSGKAVLTADRGRPPAARPTAFALLVPVYRSGADTRTRADRRAALLGWTSSPFRAQDFLDGALRRSGQALGVQLFDQRAAPENLIAESPAKFVATGGLVESRTITFAGRRWLLRFAPVPGAATNAGAKSAELLFAAGLLLTLMLAGLVLRTGPHVVEEHSEHPTRGRLSYDTVKFPLFDGYGELYATCGVALETTERQRALELLSEAEQRLHGAFENAPNGIALITLNGRFMQVNAAMCELTGRACGSSR